MSDSVEELSKEYEENVLGEHERSIGLFPIPEYPEFEGQRGMWSTALDVILTTLRYLAPATLLTLFWGQQSFLFKLLKYIDSAFRALIFSNEEQKQSVLQWLGEAGPVRVENLEVVWRHGWIVCGVLDTALPGACAGHPPTRLTLKHAQAIADHYLGVEPAFTRIELEANDSISRHQEWKLMNYLENIRLALSKITPPASKAISHTTQQASPKTTHFTMNYIARGSGLTAAQVNNKVYFKIYPTAQQSLDPGEITILINGPNETYGMSVIPPILGKAQMIRQNLLGLQSKSKYTDNVLPITQGTAYLRNYGQNDMNKTFYIPKSKYDIDIETELKQDHARIGYMANLEGKYEVSITSKGQNVVGSPFIVTASNNIVGILERDSFCLEDGEEIDIVDVKSDRKVVLRIVDFVTEKMLLRENGTLEKISEEEAKYLMENDDINNRNSEPLTRPDDKWINDMEQSNLKTKKFYNIANKVLTANRFCNILSDIKNKQKSVLKNDVNEQIIQVPDIVNSTFNDDQNKVCRQEKWNRVIIPENISVSILTEKPNSLSKDTPNLNFHNDSIDNNNLFTSDPFEDDNVDTVQSSNNPFIDDIYNQNYEMEKKLGSFITNEYESNNSQNEETANTNIKIFIGNKNESLSEESNPFIDIINMERPKTPIFRIISGEAVNCEDSANINSERKLSNEIVLNNLVNPFIDQLNAYQEKPDFIIGAPVSLPPIINLNSSASSVNNNITEISKKNQNKHKEDYNCKTHITDSTTIPAISVETDNSSNKSNFYNSLDSNLTEDVNITSNFSPTLSNVSTPMETSRETSPKKDTWDSAYVSIDENNYTDNIEFSESLNKKSPLPRDHSKLNLNEREQLQNINPDNEKTNKGEIKKSEFMPIIEENEKCLSSNTKDNMKETTAKDDVDDPVTVAFAEINDLYDDYFKTSEVSSVTTTQECQLQNLGIEYTLERNDIHVDSASEFRTDVKRQTKILEGKISEVQATVTESLSASQNLHVKNNRRYKEENNNNNISHIQFGDEAYTNIVLEKKKYWDEKIREIEEKSEEVKSLQCKRRLSSKYLRRNDSLSKRRGRKIVQNFLNTNQDDSYQLKKSVDQLEAITLQSDFNSIGDKIKCMNNNIEIYNKNESTSCFGKKSSNNKERSVFDAFKQIKVSSVDSVNMNNDNDEQKSNLHLKQELSEKVFQAFETSPKRFFGTSRKHILNKIDTFLGYPDNENETKKITNDINHETGLVSSRISLFHNISKTEELAWSRRKSKSMHNITHQENETYTNLENKSTTRDSKTVEDKENRKISSSCEESNINYFNQTDKNIIALKEKRARMIQNKHNKTFDETLYTPPKQTDTSNDYVKKTIKDINEQNDLLVKSPTSKLISISKSEMDIFNKFATATEDVLEKHKSYEELPKICVKNFISLYEDVSKISDTSSHLKSRTNVGSLNNMPVPSSIHGTAMISTTPNSPTQTYSSPSRAAHDEGFMTLNKRKQKLFDEKCLKNLSNEIDNTHPSSDTELISNQDKDASYLSLSDIEIEIIEKEPEKCIESPSENEPAHLEYKNRFTMARKYFQSLEELREEKKTKKLIKSESLISCQSTESLDENKQPRKRSKIKKSRSMPSSEISKIWNQLQEKEAENKKLVKISEKFNVDDLFEDVMEGRLSRQGSLRGIPNKKAVLETFRSMENVNDNKLNSYEMAVSQLNDFAEENKIKNAQTYLSEYPYLPTTDPSKYHSRLDTNASGLITFKELRKIPRRNSVPDLRLNPTFTADL
ncbi:AP2/ERF domain-containing protein PFD0985w-like isoform X1 [Vanessa atalanta]|uniref:AP2/ERF domain-containing protein PFD0985w-like isoform X1 n=2 Tax=Vanessa atalanta TaxID=42275 RepID=UPI001FCDD5A1|nr:AP2/ERF domain-containing protein PFD0985w-like isoform X1 [Vanessa atalanta]